MTSTKINKVASRDISGAYEGMTEAIDRVIDDAIDDAVSAKGHNFNVVFKILEASTKADNADTMISYILSELMKTYPKQFSDFTDNVISQKSTNDKDVIHDLYNDYDYDYADTSLTDELEENELNCINTYIPNSNFNNSASASASASASDSDSDSDNISSEHSNENSSHGSYRSHKSSHNSAIVQSYESQNKEDIEDKDYKDNGEILLDPKKKRFTAYPIEFPHIWAMYKSQQAAFWVTTEIDFSSDHRDFQLLNNDEKHFIKMIIAFFANSDGIVNWNLCERFTKEIQLTEALYAYQWQIMMENIHSEVYSLMLENIVTDQKEKDHMFNAIHTIPSIKKMADWAFKWIESDKSFAHRLVAFAIVEGIFFSGAFASIFWIKTHKGDIMPGLTKSNELIARDEGMHCEFACELYNYISNKLPADEIYEIINDAVIISQTFMRDALPVRLIAMNQGLMDNYIEYIADRLLSMLGYKKLYKKRNPFEFMSKIGLANKENFFEHRNTSYQDSTINNKSATGYNFEFDDEFK